MKKQIYYPNCSELLADFCIHDAKEFYDIITDLGERYEWQFDPPVTLELLKKMIKKGEESPQCVVVNKQGQVTRLQYGSNGYDSELGFWLAESGNNHYDKDQFGFFAAAADEYAAEIKAYDGGSDEPYNEWYETHWFKRHLDKARAKKHGKKK